MFRAMAAIVFGLLPCTAANAVEMHAAVIRVDYPAKLPLSRLDLIPENSTFAGAILATEDNTTTGRFLGHTYTVENVASSPEGAVEAARAAGAQVLVVDAARSELEAIADALPDALILNIGADDTELRSADCRANMLHFSPSRAMRADAVGQFLIWKKWSEWLVIHGSHPEDRALGEAYAASARKFGAKVVASLEYEDTGGARRTDSGHTQVQKDLPLFTQGAPRHDVKVVADETDYFAAWLPWHQWEPRPVLGSAGLRPVAFDPAIESWGATQFQRRMEKLANRPVREPDYLAWVALRAIGEAVTRTGSADIATLRAYMLSDDFELAAFKGAPVSFRSWNGQLRQPILLSDGRMTISVSPQDGFLHQRTTLDTLGLDEPQSECRAFGR